jgi:hypothetical protein
VAEMVTGCVTMVWHGSRSTGVWALLNRRTRVYLPQSVAVVAVGDCVTVSGWREEDRKSWFVMAQQCEPAALKIAGDVSGLLNALYGGTARPVNAYVVIELIGLILRCALGVTRICADVGKEIGEGWPSDSCRSLGDGKAVIGGVGW